jgi:hypothetical protein
LKNRENVGGYVSLFGGWIWIGNLEERMKNEEEAFQTIKPVFDN